jgi:hypothetical protein
MNIQQKTELLYWLRQAKADKIFYKKNKENINLYIRITAAEIEAESEQKEKKKERFKEFGIYFVEIVKLVTAYLKSP